MPSWIDVLADMISVYEIHESRYVGNEAKSREKLHREAYRFIKQYLPEFCSGPVMRLIKSGKVEKSWWAENVIKLCANVDKLLHNELDDCRLLMGKEYDECVGFNSVLLLDKFKWVLHSNPIGRWNLVTTFPIGQPAAPEKIEEILIVRLNEEYIPNDPVAWRVMRSADVVFDVITALRSSAYEANAILRNIARQAKIKEEEFY